ncbi:MAG: hypothetical protein JW821_14565 [Deltaproteobacteria bacterium]|nr:hypothetical protein [Deltaproteobacteria bacterium]
MSWMFWKKSSGESGANVEKLPKPRDLPEIVGRDLVVKLNRNPDWVWSLKSVERQRQGQEKIFDFRVFDLNEASMRKVPVKNYHSLDDHPELIIFEGWYDKKTKQAHIEEKGRPDSAPRAA